MFLSDSVQCVADAEAKERFRIPRWVEKWGSLLEGFHPGVPPRGDALRDYFARALEMEREIHSMRWPVVLTNPSMERGDMFVFKPRNPGFSMLQPKWDLNVMDFSE